MNDTLATPTDSARRRLLRGGLGLAASAASLAMLGRAGAATEVIRQTASTSVAASPPQVAFLSPEAGAAALAGDTYYADMAMLDIRARMKSPLTGTSTARAISAMRASISSRETPSPASPT